MIGLRALDLSFLNRERVSRSAAACPRTEIEVATGRNVIDADVTQRERLPGLANVGALRGLQKVRASAAAYNRCFAIRFDQHR